MPEINIPDFTGLSIVAIFTLTIIIGAIDTAYAILQSFIQKVFNADYLLDFLKTHTRNIWFPIFALAILGNGVSALGVPKIGASTDAAVVGLGLYLIVTIKSLIINTGNSADTKINGNAS